MDNKVFDVNGREQDMLLDALKLVFKQCGTNTTCKGWFVTQKHGLVLTWYKDTKSAPFPLGAGLSAEQVLPIVWEWLKSEEAGKTEMEGWDKDLDHDGHNTLGWRVFVEGWGHVADSSAAICAIKPAYMWHGK
jgi:hypothetical protein